MGTDKLTAIVLICIFGIAVGGPVLQSPAGKQSREDRGDDTRDT